MPRVLPALTIALGLTSTGCLLYAWHLHGRLVAAQAELAAKASQLAALHPAVAHLEPGARSGPDAGQESSELPPASPSPERPPDRGARQEARGEAMAAWRNSPEVQRLMALQRRAGLDGRYAALFRKLNLSPADLEKFKALLVDKQSAAMDVMSTAREQGLVPSENRDQIRQLIQNFEAETDTAIRFTLGEAAYQQYQQYEQTAPQRNVVGQLEQRLSYSGAPLYGNQSEQLVSLLAASSPGARNVITAPGPAGPGAAGGRGVNITDAIVTQSQGFLSQPQVEALRQLQQEQAAQAELRQQMQQAQQARRNASGATATSTSPTGPGP